MVIVVSELSTMSLENLVRRVEIAEAGKPLRLTTIPMPPLPSHMVRIKVAYAGICHSDLHFWETVASVEQKLGFKLEGVVLGHEISGIVDEVGQGVKDGKFKIGDRIIVYPWKGCQQCETCSIGQNNLCTNNPDGTKDIGQSLEHPGGYQSHINVYPDLLLKVDPVLGLRLACMVPCSVSTAYSALKNLAGFIQNGIKKSGTARLLLFGAGGLGLWAVTLAKVMFTNVCVTSVDIDETKLNLAKDAGADDAIMVDRKDSAQDSADRITKSGMYNAAIDFVGSSTTAESTLLSLQSGGGMVAVGLFGGKFSCPLSLLIGRSLSVIGMRTSTREVMAECLDLVTKKNLSYPKLQFINHEDINEAHRILSKGQIQGRMIIKY